MSALRTPLEVARQQIMLSMSALWVRYIGLGGNLGLGDMTAHLLGAGDVSRVEHNTLVHALNEAYMDHGMNHPVAYAEDDASQA